MDFDLHHIGNAVPDISIALEFYTYILKYNIVSDYYEHEIMNTRALFLENNETRIELIEKICKDKKSPIDGILEKLGGGLHHQCFRVDDIPMAIDYLQTCGFVTVRNSSVLCNDINATFLITPNCQLIEIMKITNRKG